MPRPKLTPPAMDAPTDTTLKAYQVGFGDCFLLTFHYGNEKRSILIDFGTTGMAKGFPEDQMHRVALDIENECRDSKFFGVVATHRHKDHISGFSTQGKGPDGRSTGEVIRGLDPDLVILPWTEDPDLKTDATSGMIEDSDFKREPNKGFVAGLSAMQAAAGAVKEEARRLSLKKSDLNPGGYLQPINEKTARHLSFMGENNLPNLSAVKNLVEMAAQLDDKREPKGRYVNYGAAIDLAEFLPGVTVKVLGPPTLEQYEKIKNQRSRDKDEFWMLRAIHKNYWGIQAATADLLDDLNENPDTPSQIFPDAGVYERTSPSHTRWFTRRIRAMRAEQLVGLVRILDDAMNNTSVILLFEVGSQKLLFPGDAQIENWEFALKFAPDKDDNLRALRDTTLYKVGHHGSRNATPKTLWKTFSRKAPTLAKDDAMHTVNSTMPGKHGTKPETAVPRETLVQEMSDHSRYHSTEEVTDVVNGLFIEIPLQG